MKASVATLAYTLLSGAPSFAVSNEAEFIREESQKSWQSFQQSRTFGYAEVFVNLDQVARECARTDWDGYEAMPVRRETIDATAKVLRSLPLGLPRPTVGAEPDGHVTLEWHASRSRTLSVSVSPDGFLHYAALLGTARHYGTEPFLGEFPRTIWELIRKVHRT